MSGVEAAGLALAVFPLLVSALEHYRESAEVLGDWWKFKRKYVKCKRDIEYHQITYTANLEELLLPLIVDDDELEHLVADPGGARWSDSTLESRLRARLPNTYEAYLDSMNEISSIMKDLQKELGLDNSQLQARVTSTEEKSSRNRSAKESLGYQSQRIKFALGQTTRDKLLDDFAKYNGRLRDLLKTGDRISAIKKTNRAPKMGAILMSLWRHAKALYAALSDSWGCKGDCRSTHRADLLLCHRETAAEIKFQLLLLSTGDAPHALWGWHKASAKVTNASSKATSLQNSISSIAEEPLTPLTAPNMPKHKSMSFTKPSILSRSRMATFSSSSSTLTYSSRTSSATFVGVKWSDTQSTVLPDNASNADEVIKPPIVTELCAHLCGQKLHDVALNDSNSDIQYDLETTKSQTCDLIALDSLLGGGLTTQFPRRKRYYLAHILASSQAHLQSTPWLKNDWQKKDIVFTKDCDRIAFDEPRLSGDFAEKRDESVEDHSVALLGMVLLELCFGSPLETHPLRQKMPVLPGPQNFYLDLAAALQWSEAVIDEAGPAYANAVRWCLSQPAAPVKDEKFRAELYEQVVRPLQECHDHLA